MSKYLNPYTDFGFKKLFGEEANKDLLIDFLNQLLPPHHQIAELSFKNTEQLPEVPLGRKAIFDIYCISTTGERFIVEMQKAKMQFFKDRSVYYMTFPIREQAKKGHWLFKLAPVYFIAILDFEYDEAEEMRKFRRDIALRDEDGTLFFDKLHFKFLQMPLFNKQEHELETHFDKWIYFLKNLEDFDDIPAILNEPIFQKAFEIAALVNLNYEQYTKYEENLLDYWTNRAVMVTAWDEGVQQGLQQGIQQGLQQGIQQGLQQGIQQGLQQGVQEGLQQGAKSQALVMARKLREKGFSLVEVCELTGLTTSDLSDIFST
jgi:predicted transposase/invertase (TIGR01784 family)